MEIKALEKTKWYDAMSLAWRVFLKFEASDYTPEGVRNFYRFLTNSELEKMFLLGEYVVYVACEGEEIIGMASLRSRNHLSLLFVDEEYHKRGVGRALISCIAEYVKLNENQRSLTVHSSPYAVGFYHKIGFVDEDEEQEANGITYTPMILNFA